MADEARHRFLRWVGHDQVIVNAAPTEEWLKKYTRNVPGQAKDYVRRLFPFLKWLPNYNLRWGIGDLIAGLTIGMVVVPQGMSYAQLATLPPEYGLYSSFIGVMIYALFATSKDVTIGPVAVMSTLMANNIANIQAKDGGDAYSGAVIGSALAFLCGVIALGVGALRLGFLVDLISAPSVAGYITGSAFNVVVGQLPTLFGYSGKFNTRAATYKVAINFLKHLPDTTRDAAFGLTGLAFLLAMKFGCGAIERRAKNPYVRQAAFFIGTLRTAFLVILQTAAAYGYLRHMNPKSYPIKILKTGKSLPSGFKHMGVPNLDSKLLSLCASELPASVIVLIIEHVSIAKSFGRINGYQIDPAQELIAIGINNIFSSFFGAYPSTGSFSRSALKSKSGVRTPLAGWVTGIVVVVALYGLTDAFYWIPNATLSAVIIDAVGGLLAPLPHTYQFWLVNPIECIIFLGAVIITTFVSIDVSIYFSVCASAALLLFRMAQPRGAFLGRVRLSGDSKAGANKLGRDIWLPLDRKPQPGTPAAEEIVIEPPPPGVLVFKMEESYLYINASRYSDQIVAYVREYTRNGQDYSQTPVGDRPWNNPGPPRFTLTSCTKRSGKGGVDFAELERIKAEENARRPLLRSLVLDFSGVTHIDTTSTQNLIDLRRVLERYADGPVAFHFASILSPWIKRALLAGGFGRDPTALRSTSSADTSTSSSPQPTPIVELGAAVPQGSHADLSSQPHRRPTFSHQATSGIETLELRDVERGADERTSSYEDEDLKKVGGEMELSRRELGRASLVESLTADDFPYFHIDLPSAVAAAVGRPDW